MVKGGESGALITQRVLSSLRLVYGEELGKLEESIQKAIAYRAYDLFQRRGRSHGRDLEDWFRAEDELARPTDIEISEGAGQLRVRARLSGLSAGEIQLGLAPRKLIVWGQTLREDPAARSGVRRVRQTLGEIELPVAVDPKKASATFNAGILVFQAPKTRSP